MRPHFLSHGPLVKEGDISAFEERCGFALTPDYRRFLLEQNGGERAAAARTKRDIAREGALRRHRFFSLAAVELPLEELLALGWEVREAWPELLVDLDARMRWCREGGYPEELLPVAEVGHEAELLLQLAGADVGSVHYHYDPDGYHECHCYPIASSFDELLRNFENWSFA